MELDSESLMVLVESGCNTGTATKVMTARISMMTQTKAEIKEKAKAKAKARVKKRPSRKENLRRLRLPIYLRPLLKNLRNSPELANPLMVQSRMQRSAHSFCIRKRATATVVINASFIIHRSAATSRRALANLASDADTIIQRRLQSAHPQSQTMKLKLKKWRSQKRSRKQSLPRSRRNQP